MAFNPDQLPIPDLGLRCRRCGYGLAGLPRHQCPECGQTFTMDEMVPPGDFPIVIFNGSELRGKPEVLDLLRQSRIPFIEILGPAEAMYGMVETLRGRSRIAVPRASYFEVIDLLRRQALAEPLPPVEETTAPDWTCPSCQAENPGTFDICWSCEAARSG